MTVKVQPASPFDAIRIQVDGFYITHLAAEPGLTAHTAKIMVERWVSKLQISGRGVTFQREKA